MKAHKEQSDRWSFLEGEAVILMRVGKVLDLGESFKGDVPGNDSLICPVRFSVSVFYSKKKQV